MRIDARSQIYSPSYPVSGSTGACVYPLYASARNKKVRLHDGGNSWRIFTRSLCELKSSTRTPVATHWLSRAACPKSPRKFSENEFRVRGKQSLTGYVAPGTIYKANTERHVPNRLVSFPIVKLAQRGKHRLTGYVAPGTIYKANTFYMTLMWNSTLAQTARGFKLTVIEE